MRIVKQSHEILHCSTDTLQMIEKAGRTCYKSESNIGCMVPEHEFSGPEHECPDELIIGDRYDTVRCSSFCDKHSSHQFVKNLIKRGHDAMLEFGDITVKFVTDRGVTHEMVRHRLCSFAQESTRYVKYDKRNMEFIEPVWWGSSTETEQMLWFESMESAENHYIDLMHQGWKAQEARSVLPNSLKTEIVVKGNTREWRHIFQQRCAKTAHPQMYELMRPLLEEVKSLVPILYDDISY